MFLLGQKVVYPGYGVAEVTKIFEKKVSESVIKFFQLKFFGQTMKDTTVMVAMDRAKEVGIRPLSSSDFIHTMFETFMAPAKKIDQHELSASNWNRRNKEYQNKLRTGSLKDISEIYRDLKHIANHKELSFGEKNLLSKTELLLVEEIAAAENVDKDTAIERLRSFFVPAMMMSHQQRTI